MGHWRIAILNVAVGVVVQKYNGPLFSLGAKLLHQMRNLVLKDPPVGRCVDSLPCLDVSKMLSSVNAFPMPFDVAIFPCRAFQVRHGVILECLRINTD